MNIIHIYLILKHKPLRNSIIEGSLSKSDAGSITTGTQKYLYLNFFHFMYYRRLVGDTLPPASLKGK